MSVLQMPAGVWPQLANWGLQKAGAGFRSGQNGTLQSVSFVAEYWACTLTLRPYRHRDPRAGRAQALLNLMAGGVNYLEFGHPQQLVPRGTLRGTPVVQTSASRGAPQLQLGNCTPGATLLAGDMIGVPVANQLFQVAFDAVADSGGLMMVYVANRVRSAIPAGTAVAWNQPKTRFNCPSFRNDTVLRPGYCAGAVLDLVEAWIPEDEPGTEGPPPGALLLGDGWLMLDGEGGLILS